MAYSFELQRSIDDVDGNTWRDLFRNSASLFLDPRFLKVLELSFAHETALWYVIFRDQTDRAVAATCFCRFRADVLLLAPPLIHTCADYVRRAWPGFLKYNVLVYRMLEQAFVPGIHTIHCGAAADQFKQRLGCQGRWLSIYFKSSNPLRHRYLLKPVFNMLFRRAA